MSGRRLAWTIWGASLAFGVAWVVLDSFVETSEDGPIAYVFILGSLLLYATVGALITSRQLENRIGLIFAWVAFAAAVGGTCGAYARLAVERGLPFATATTWVANLGVVAIIGPIAFLFLIYPTGTPSSRRWRLVLNVMMGAYAITLVLFAVTPGRMKAGFADFHSRMENPIGLPASWKQLVETTTGVFGTIVFVGAIVSVVALVQRYRRAEATERQQIRWLMLLGGVTAIYIAVVFTLEITGIMPDNESDVPFLVLVFLIFIGIPVTCAIAILKHGLWDLDVVVKKTVQYGVLVVLFSAVIGIGLLLAPAVVVGVGTDVGGISPGFVLGIVITIAFLLLRARARRWANRIVYGKRSSPYEVLSEFAENVGETYSTEDVLPRMAQLLGQATGARVARVWLRIGPVMRPEASWPQDAAIPNDVAAGGDELPALGDDRAFEVRHQGELLGALSVTEAPDDPMTASKEKLVRNMAAQAGLVLRNVRLIEDLRESRRRIVAAQDARAKSLERNIHDGAQQQLVALQVKQRLVDSMIEKDPRRARAMMAELQQDTAAALEDLRDLARGIYPPLLADKGLTAALQGQARKSPIPVAVEPDGIGRYPQETEAAVYFSCLEALQNVAKYANATRATVRLSQSNIGLSFEVVDDGVGFDPAVATLGSGLQGIADRLAALGGAVEIRSAPGSGTTITGRIPSTPLVGTG